MKRVAPLLILLASAHAEVRLPYILADNMVVQRSMPVHLWGSAAPAERVTVAFRGETRETTADATGRWEIYLSSGEAGGPFDLRINTKVLRNVLVGDVWIAAGQSNMEWPIDWSSDPSTERAAAKFPNIRLVRTMHRVSDYPREDWVGQPWEECSPKSVAHFSAVGYHFARNLHEQLKVPIGVIQAAWGGTPAEAWTSLRGLSSNAVLMPIFAEWAKSVHTNAPNHRRGPGGPWTPAGLFNGMIAPLTKLPIRGVIWYQGEANTASERAPTYEFLFQTLIRDWRDAWGQGDFPFLFVQLANFNADPESMWPRVREAQRRALSVANTAMVVSIDIGTPDDIHPGNKREVGRRLSLAARATVYGERIEYSGPLFRQAFREEQTLRLRFDHAKTLIAKGDLGGFEIAGSDGKYVPAEARIQGPTVVVSSPTVRTPVRVRYAWKDNPVASLFNDEGLPASPFRHEP